MYNRSPSAYEALRNLSILQLPCTKVLKNVLNDGAEQPGIDKNYFESQQAKYKEYEEQTESGGHPQPLGIGVMMWDEVKVNLESSRSYSYIILFFLYINLICQHIIFRIPFS